MNDIKKIYVIISVVGEDADREVTPEIAFENMDEAEQYLKELQFYEQGFRNDAERCQQCGGSNHDCPKYVASFYESDECDSYNPWHDNVYYEIKEVPLM